MNPPIPETHTNTQTGWHGDMSAQNPALTYPRPRPLFTWPVGFPFPLLVAVSDIGLLGDVIVLDVISFGAGVRFHLAVERSCSENIVSGVFSPFK